MDHPKMLAITLMKLFPWFQHYIDDTMIRDLKKGKKRKTRNEDIVFFFL